MELYIKDQFNKFIIKDNYRRNNIPCIFDPFRNKLVPLTKEEIVRQKAALFFKDIIGVPKELIFIEEHLSHWNCSIKGRADIVIGCKQSNEIHCLAVIECKSEEIPLTNQVFHQCEVYANELSAEYIIILNGIEMQCYHVAQNSKYEMLSKIPTYKNMVSGHYIVDKSDYQYARYSTGNWFTTNKDLSQNEYIGEDTPNYLMPHIINLADCIYDTSHKLPPQKHNNTSIIDDLGVCYLGYGDASGGNFGTGMYRSILIEDNQKNNQIISFGIAVTGKTNDHPKYGNSTGKSVLVVSMQDFAVDYTVVQINLNKFLSYKNNTLSISHNGAVMLKNAHKEDLFKLISANNSSLVINNTICLGEYPTGKILFMDSPEVIPVILNIIDYALIRNEYKQVISLKNKLERTKNNAEK